MAVTVGMLAGQASAQESNWLVRARAVHIDPADKADPVGGVGASDRISVENKTIPEVDISYFFTKNIAAELVLTYPQKHEVYLDGKSIGTFKHLPPSLMAQYHFTPEKNDQPVPRPRYQLDHVLEEQAAERPGQPGTRQLRPGRASGRRLQARQELVAERRRQESADPQRRDDRRHEGQQGQGRPGAARRGRRLPLLSTITTTSTAFQPGVTPSL